MSVLTSTGITFGDGTSQSTAAGKGGAVVYTASGTWTVPSGVTSAKVTILAGGGNGGNSYRVKTGTFTWSYYGVGGGGGAGGAAIKVLTGLAGGETISVTVGGVATASSAVYKTTTISATGGANASNGTQGTGGVGSGGDINLSGDPGRMVLEAAATAYGGYNITPGSGDGGRSIAGRGGFGGFSGTSNGNASPNKGAGGGGASNPTGGSGSTYTGGAGQGGFVIIEYW